MRLLTARLSARLSRGRRSRFAGVVVLLLGLLVTGGAYAVLSPAQAERRGGRPVDGRAGPRAVPRRLRLLPRQERRGHRHLQNGTSTARRSSASAPPRSTSRSAPAGCRWPRPGVQAPQKEVVYTDEEIAALAAFVASLGPGPAIPEAGGYDPRRDPRGRARGGDRPRRRVLPHQLHGLPQLRGLRRRAARRQVRPLADRRRRRSTSTRRCSPARSRCRSSPTRCSRPRRSATSSPTSRASRSSPKYGGSHDGLVRPGQRGPLRLAGRHRRLRRLRRLDRLQLARAPRREPRRERPHAPTSPAPPRAPRGADRRPRAARAPAAPDRRRRRRPRSAPSGRSRRFRPLGGDGGPVLRRLLRLRDRRGPRPDPRVRRLQRRAGRDPRPGPAVHRHRRDPVGAQADERRRDRRDAAPDPLHRRRPRRGGRAPSTRASTTPASPAGR